MATNLFNLAGYIQGQGDMGRERGQQSALARLASQAYGAAPQEQSGIVKQAVAVDPGSGFRLAGELGKQREADYSELGRAAAIFQTIPDDQKPQFYAENLAPLAHKQGLPVPPVYDAKFAPAIAKIGEIAGRSGQSAQLQTFSAMTQGLAPDDVARARRIQLGLDPRAVTGAMKFDTFQGADGRPRPQRNNPTTGGIEIFYDETGQWVPLGQGAGQPGPTQRAPGEVPFSVDPTLPPQVQAAIRSNPDAGSASGIQPGALQQIGQPRVPGLGVGRAPEEQAAATTAAQEAARLQFLPRELGLRTNAAIQQAVGTQQAKTQAERTTDAQQKKVALDVFTAGMDELERAMSETVTGPILGRVPAMSAEQQTADGTVAAMAPVLKQLFRSAGEGVFTDRDQALLIEMLPTRADHPEARKAKAANVRRMVNAKLQQALQAPQGNSPQASGAADPLGIL